MAEDPKNDFSLPWCEALRHDPSMESMTTFSRIQHTASTENALFATTLNSPNTVRASETFLKRSADCRPAGNSVYQLFSLGSGLNSISGVCHGAMVTLMLDEAFAQLMTSLFARDELVTGELVVSFKRPLKTPAVVLCRTWFAKEPEGRKHYLNGEVQDGFGYVYAEGRGIILTRKVKGRL